jgi:ribosomal protein L40E
VIENGPNDSGVVHPHVDADAVCERCGTVNPEDTFLCKTCGNNLRDQRRNRVAAGAVPDLEEPEDRVEWIKRGVAVFGILAAVWIALNVDTIAGWLVEVGQPPAAAAFWRAPENEIYEQLASQIGGRRAGPAEVEQGRANASSTVPLDGLYVIVPGNSQSLQPRALGLAAAKREGNLLYFLAQLNNGAEVRGFAQIDRRERLRAPDSVGVRNANDYYDAVGVAQRQNGAFACLGGLLDANGEQHSVMAYPLPR